MSMRTIRARIHQGRLVSVDPVALPEGSELEVTVPAMEPQPVAKTPSAQEFPDNQARNKAFLALLEKWKAEPGDYDERVWPALKRELEEDPIAFREPNIEPEQDQ